MKTYNLEGKFVLVIEDDTIQNKDFEEVQNGILCASDEKDVQVFDTIEQLQDAVKKSGYNKREDENPIR